MLSVHVPMQSNVERKDTVKVNGLKPEVWGRVGPDPWAEPQVDPA